MQIPAGKEITRYFYEGNRVVLELDASGTITAHNTYSINLASRRAGEEGYYYLYNAHGDVVTLVGMQDHREVRYRYDAFGTLLEVTGDADNSITYAGYQYDSESGLYYLNARYYDSTTARFLTEDTYAGQANDPLSLHRYTYCANNPLRYTDPDGHFWGAVLRFVAGAVVGAVTEFVTQKFIEKRDKIDVKAILYEGVVGGVTSVIGGVGGAAKKAGKTAKTAKAVVKTTAKAGAKEATLAFAEDLGRQVFVDGKSLKEVDYGQSLEAGASAGVTAVIDELDSVLGTKKQLSTTNRKKASQATGVIDDAADAAPRKRVDALPDAEGMPNRGAVKNATGGLADAGSGAGSAGRKSKTAVSGSKIKSSSVNKSSPSLTKNQNKIQSQIVDSTLSGNTIKTKSKSKEIPPLPYTEKWKKYFREVYGEENVEWQNRDYGMGGGRSNNIKYSNKMKKWIPMDADGNPIPLKEHKHKNTSIPLPDPAFEGQPHIVFGGRISSDTGELYLQTAIFDGKDDWLKVNGHPVPRTVIDWTNHYMPWAHDNPHQHVFYYDFKEKKMAAR